MEGVQHEGRLSFWKPACLLYYVYIDISLLVCGAIKILIGAGLAVEAIPLSCKDSGYVSLSPSSIIRYQPNSSDST